MKRLAFAILVVAFMAGCANLQVLGSQAYSHPHHHGNFSQVMDMPASRAFTPGNLDELEYLIPNIVRGRVGNDPTIVYQYALSGPSPSHNRVSIEILEVIRGDLQVGETVNILEPYFIEDNVLFTWANYMPSRPNHEYFFFLGDQLGEYTDTGRRRPESFLGAYFVLRGEFGRHRVPESNMRQADSTFNTNELSLGTHVDTELYMSIWQEVIDAYMDWGRPPVTSHRTRVDSADLQQGFDVVIDMP